MFRQGDTIRPWPGESITGTIMRVEQDPEGHAGYWCETPTGTPFFIAEKDVQFSMVKHSSVPMFRMRRRTDTLPRVN